MKKCLLFFLCLFSLSSFAQSLPGQWTWISGDSLTEQPAVYGTKGVADPANKPFASEGAATWRDQAGDIWLFGGQYSTRSGTYYLNDLWKYSPASGVWTWMSGDGVANHPGVYGTKGVPDVANRPGGRQSMNYWIDAAGNLWIFGGLGYSSTNIGYLNDLWKYSPASNQWTWMSGTSADGVQATYGQKGVPDPASMPGGRYGAISYMDNSGNLYIFGGLSDFGTDGNIVNNLWMYTPGTNLWTWVGGSGNALSFANYGTKGVASPTTQPGGRIFGNGWKDNQGNFWVFGGRGYTSTFSSTPLNDLWEFSPLTRQWTWISGDTAFTNFPGNRGTKGVASDDTRPGSRERATSWTDAAGFLWLYGGAGFTSGPYNVNDELFKFNTTTQQWMWVNGGENSSPAPVYGTKGISNPSNTPGARTGAAGVTDASGNLLLFGGTKSNGTGNDLWKYTLAASTLPVKLNGFTAQKDQQSVVLRWQTDQEQNSFQFVIERSSNGIQYTKIGAVRASGNSTVSQHYVFTDRSPLSGKNLYRIQQQDQDGKAVASPTAQVDFAITSQGLEVLGNPVRSELQLRLQLQAGQTVHMEVLDLQGHLLQKMDKQAQAGVNVFSFPAGHLSKGTYVVQASIGGEKWTKQFVKL